MDLNDISAANARGATEVSFLLKTTSSRFEQYLNAASFIAIHNHPSGNLNPSEADKILTERLMTCGKYMDIKMLDHIIVAGETGEMFSFKGEGLMNQIERNAPDWTR